MARTKVELKGIREGIQVYMKSRRMGALFLWMA